MNTKIRRIATGSLPFVPGAFAILLAVAIVLAPESSFEASMQGLKLWWTLVFPALLPFLILSEMLTASGLVHGFGVLLEPLMVRLFRLPGAGGWTLALGATTGFPGGTQGVMQLHQQGSITDKEAGRLAALSHFASPVTLLIVVGATFLHSASAGYTLLIIHWVSGLLAGFTASRFAPPPHQKSQPAMNSRTTVQKSLIRRIIHAASEARTRDGRSFGKLLGESVASAVQNLMIVGGYMIMFAVIINIIISLLPSLPGSLPSSLLELHLGAQALTSGSGQAAASSTLNTGSMALLSAALGWSGVCALMQVLTLLKPASVRFLPYAAVRLLHGLYAFGLTFCLWKVLYAPGAVQPAIARLTAAPSGTAANVTMWNLFPQLLRLQLLLLALLLVLSSVIYMFTSLRRSSG
ncbi:sporulation integral membrane protein YlbJ [Paenibacillus albidus]|uniref:Sporulation integral membrane protein YlbJ n=1 Tax=Paenibacillus albidus TaxID=2041023 RepID=A0A917FCH8_9BACL|nr:nucleoside recognition domain-containing protein [Paenibacillus albidus]GGF68025.1 sporulation integral membrane protein YlbJ [Paenibacillus albidus]